MGEPEDVEDAPTIEQTLSRGSRVLVVDDDPVVRMLLKASLVRQDRTLLFASDGNEALQILRDAAPHVVLLDLGLPGMPGSEVLSEMRERAPETDIIVITATNEVPVAVSALQAGATDFLLKPLDLAQIDVIVDRVLEGRRQRITSNLARIVHTLSTTQDLDRLGSLGVEAAKQATLASSGAVFKLTDEGFETEAYSGGGGAMRLDAVAEQVFASGACRGWDDSGPVLGWPMMAHRSPVGAIAVCRPPGAEGFTLEDEQKLSVVAAEVALSMDRARLVQRLRNQVDLLAKARLQLAAAEQLQGVGHLATGYAHELQGPIQYLRGHLRGLREAIHEGDMTQATERLGYASEALDRIQGSVGDLSLLGRSRNDSVVAGSRLVGLARRMLGDVPHVAIEEEIETCSVRGNVGHLAQILVHLLRNAVRAVEGVKRPSVRIRVGSKRDQVFFEIRDNGPGFGAAGPKGVLEPFFSTWGRNGLGLGVARELTGDAGGRLLLEDAPSGGAIATLFLAAVAQEQVFELGDG